MKSSRLTALAVAACTCLALVGCGNDDSSGTSDAAAQPQQGGASQAPGGFGGGPGGGPGGGTSGLVAERTGTTLQVQGNGTQTAVTFGDDTELTQQVDGTVDDLAEGQCVMVRLAPEGDDEDAAATSVSVTSTDGDCGFGMPGGAGRGAAPEGMEPPDGAEMPEGMEMPEDGERPSPPEGGGFGGMVMGTVTAVSATSLTVESVGFGDEEAEEQSVALDGGTTVSVRREAAASDVKVGVCVQAVGEADDNGAVVATSLSLSAAVDGECGGFGGGGGPGQMPGGGDAADQRTES